MASIARTTPWSGSPVAVPEIADEDHTMPVPDWLPLAETERAAALEKPELFGIVPWEAGFV